MAPPSLVATTELIPSLLSPIFFAHSTTPELLYFIIKPPLLVNVSFPTCIVPEKSPPTMAPPSLVDATDLI